MNPIEFTFSKVKAELKKDREVAATDVDLAIHNALTAVTPRDMQGYFRHCGYKSVPVEGDVEREQEAEDLAVAHAMAADGMFTNTVSDPLPG